MRLTAGTRLGSFEILAPLGVGGMGEVYRARDTKLDRDVAIKILSDPLAERADLLARFEREAKLLASLNHPNIAAIYGLEHANAIDFLVLELVEGETLAERIARGPIALADAVDIARQIAEGLEEAHERGVIHRDLKPANVKLTPDGKIKILDFGLAKAFSSGPETSSSSDLSQSPTLARTGTESGIILGTIAYMAPEQARGKQVDRRADVWAFGVVLFEMLTGRKLFEGETASDIMAAVLTREPDWSALARSTPPAIRHLLHRSLERNVRRRLQAIGEARLILEDPGAGASEVVSRRAHRAWLAALAGGLVLFAAGWVLKPDVPGESSAVRKVDLSIADLGTQGEQRPVISPDGAHVAYVAAGRLQIRDLASFESIEIPNAPGAMYPFWSPDGGQLAYVSQGRAWKVAADGGQPTEIGVLPNDFGGSGGGTWTDDGRLVFAGSASVGLWELPAEGGDGKEILPLDRETEADFHEVTTLPEKRGFLFTVHRRDSAADTIVLWAGGSRRVLLQIPGERLRHPLYSFSGHVLYERETTNPGIWAVPFSLDRLESTGSPILIVPDAKAPSEGRGVLAIVRAEERPVELVRVSREGRADSFGKVTESRYKAGTLSLSPEGDRVAVNVAQPGGHLWVYDLDRGSSSQLAPDTFELTRPVWTPDGERVIYASGRSARSWNVSARRADAAGDQERLWASDELQAPLALSPDGRWLIYLEATGARRNLFKRSLDAPGNEAPLFSSSINGMAASFSVDGRWLAYESDESGRNEVYVRPFPEGDRRFQISTGGGEAPVWWSNGEIVYLEGDRLVAVTVTVRGDALEISRPAVLFETDERLLPRAFDVSADGQSFLMLRSNVEERISLIFNWPSELARLARDSSTEGQEN